MFNFVSAKNQHLNLTDSKTSLNVWKVRTLLPLLIGYEASGMRPCRGPDAHWGRGFLGFFLITVLKSKRIKKSDDGGRGCQKCLKIAEIN